MVGLLFQNHKVKYYLLGFVLFRSSTCRVLSNKEQGCWSHVWFSHVQLHWGCNKIIHSSIIIWYLCFVLKFSFFLEKENNWKAVLPKKKNKQKQNKTKKNKQANKTKLKIKKRRRRNWNVKFYARLNRPISIF